MASFKGSNEPSNNSINFELIKTYIDLSKPLKRVELIKRSIDAPTYLHWGMLFQVEDKMIVFDYCNDGIHYYIDNDRDEIYKKFMPR